MLNKKSTTPISIVILVFLTLLLVSFSLYTFLSQKAKSEKFFYQSFEDIYADKARIEFYLGQGLALEEAIEAIGAVMKEDQVEIKREIGEGKNRILAIYEFIPEKSNK